MSSLIAIDPGDFAGVALFEDELLKRVEFVVGAARVGWKWEGPSHCDVVCEVPQKYVGSNAEMQSLLTLAVTAGYLIGAVQPSTVRTCFPRDWKGQRPKKVDNAYTLKLLTDQERQILEGSDIPASQRHNVIDAIGIGLWALRRRK